MEMSIVKFKDLGTDYNLMYDALMQDIAIVRAEMKKKDIQTWRRMYIKSMVSLIEMQTSYLRKHITITQELDYLGLTDTEQQVLFKLDKDNRKVNYNKLSLEQYIVFVLEIFAYVNYSFITIDRKSKDYNYLVVLIHTRHRITHPDKFSETSINDNELKMCERAFGAYQHTMEKVLRSSANELMKSAKGLEKFVQSNSEIG